MPEQLAIGSVRFFSLDDMGCGIIRNGFVSPTTDRYNEIITITITLPPATEERLLAQSKATGKNINTLVVEAVEARLSLASLSLRDILAPVHSDFQQRGMNEAELDSLLRESLDESRSERKRASGSSA